MKTLKNIRLIYKHTHRDYKGMQNGKHTVLANVNGTTCLVAIEDLEDKEFAEKLAYAESKEVMARFKKVNR